MGARAEFKPFDVTEYLDTAAARAEYLRAMWEDSSGDPVTVAMALGDVARAIGMSQIARDTGVAREALYKALSPKGNPELATIMRVLGAVGLELSVRPRKAASAGATRTAALARVEGKAGTPLVRKKAAPRRPTAKRRVTGTAARTAGGAK